MDFLVQLHTDVGIKKATNQDSLCVIEAETDNGKILMAIICDGMGGLEKGEVASSLVINRFVEWFENELPLILQEKDSITNICLNWQDIIEELNIKIASYGEKNNLKLGTTLTCILFLDNSNFLIAHVGDTRIYRITDNNIKLITQDQTLVAKEIESGRLSPEQAESDPRRSILLQCVGASKILEPDIRYGSYTKNECYLICSDGFRHVITADEIKNALCPSNNLNEDSIKNNLINLIELNKSRFENDNISGILVKII